MTAPNRLARERSPYLLQHADNPVDWYPWGEEAFERARQEDRPILLSVGYSTCHWCHVMAHESFEDPAIAELINAHFVAIKVDREERPDVDRIYMLATQALSGHGGWPMTVFLAPDLRPFFAGTYFPPTARYGRPGLQDVLLALSKLWREDRARVLDAATQLAGVLEREAQVDQRDELPGSGVATDALRALAAGFDRVHGGFGGAPKFPRPAVYGFLLAEHARRADGEALRMALASLRAMAAGGLRDHLGGGFHRYSTDAQWRVPHFEKMLYDQAQLVPQYLEAWRQTGAADLAAVARDTCDYVLDELTDAGGAFHSAEDADSALAEDPARHAEGAYYTWTAAEIAKQLGADAERFCYAYGVEPHGNALSDPQGELAGRNVLYLAHAPAQVAERFGEVAAAVEAALARARATLRAHRATRPRPHRDDKIVTAWNALMISALSRAAALLEAPRYRSAAQRAAEFLLQHLRDPARGELSRSWRAGAASGPGQLQDYAFLVQALLDLHACDFDSRWLAAAEPLLERQEALFGDAAHGGYFETVAGDASIRWRLKDSQDAAEPAGNSIAALNLLRLGRLLDRADWQQRGRETIAAFGMVLRAAPTAMPAMLCALDVAGTAPRQVVIAGAADAPDTQALLRSARRRLRPADVLLLADGGAGQAWLATRVAFLRDLRPGARAAAYVCRDYRCELPISEPRALEQALA